MFFVIGYVIMGLVSINIGTWCVKRVYSEASRNHLRDSSSELVWFMILNFFFWWLTIPGHIIYSHATSLARQIK